MTTYFELEDIYMREPTIKDKDKVWELRQEFIDNDESLDGSSGLKQANSYKEWFDSLEAYKHPTNPKFVPATQFLTFRKSDDRLVGVVQVRHYLNDFLINYGGHIGDAIRKSERNKGYATRQIKLALEFCKSLGLDKVLVTCHDDNIASEKTILKNGGVFENIFIFEGSNIKRFWIKL